MTEKTAIRVFGRFTMRGFLNMLFGFSNEKEKIQKEEEIQKLAEVITESILQTDMPEGMFFYCKENGLSHDEVVYIGDDYGLGGNDESVYKSDFKYINIDNYLDFPKIIKSLL